MANKQEKVTSMLGSKISRAALLALGLGLVALAPGCTLEAQAPVVEAGYEPAYYDGYVVYYDGAGVPYYYVDGDIRYVPRTYVQYGALVHHYSVYRPYYHRWYVGGGYRYKRYHNPHHAPVAHPHRTPASPSHPHGGSHPRHRR